MSAQFSLADWPGTGWQGLSSIILIIYFFPAGVCFVFFFYTRECFLGLCVVSIAVTYLKARWILNNC